MAILKEIELENGAVVNYHRITDIQFLPNTIDCCEVDENGNTVKVSEAQRFKIIVEYKSYINETKRRENSQYFIENNNREFEISSDDLKGETLYSLAYKKLMENIGGISRIK